MKYRRVKYACFHCRISNKGGHCGECGRDMLSIGTRWRMAKRSDKKAWKEDYKRFVKYMPYDHPQRMGN